MMSPRSSHSADVQIRLEVAGKSLNVGQVGRDFCILRDRIVTEPIDAELVVSIDGHMDRTKVFLPEGISEGREIIPLKKSFGP